MLRVLILIFNPAATLLNPENKYDCDLKASVRDHREKN